MKGERRELTPQMKKRRRKKNIIGFTFILPSLIGFILFMAYPLIYSLVFSIITCLKAFPVRHFVAYKII